MTKHRPHDRKKFAAFIMTFERPEVLQQTLRRIQEQTLPPSYILVVDNSESRQTEKQMAELHDEHVGYFRVGYNSGPAGAAKKGLEHLSEMGFEWIFWGDDDDPPSSPGSFENLFNQLEKCKQGKPVGVFGSKGGRLSRLGRIHTFSNAELRKNEFLEVDMIPGGGNMIVNAAVIRQGALPKEKLFFGFEELEFCLQVKDRGYRAIITTGQWLEENYGKGYRSDSFRWRDSFLGRRDLLWRGYYSTRNLLYIFLIHKYHLAFGILFLKAVIKSFIGFRYGIQYGAENFRLQWRALRHLLLGHFGS